MHPRPIKISEHARSSMRKRRIDIDELLATLNHYEQTDRQKNGHKRYFKGRLCVVVAEGHHFDTVITILLRSYELWTDEDAINRDK